MSLLSVVVTLFLVMDPLGNVPLFLTALRGTKPERRQRVIARELLIALVVMVVFLLLGRGLLDVIHVSQEALTAAGGVILLLIAIRMIFPSENANMHEAVLGEPYVVPLAVPYTAGPSLLATEILLASSNPGRMPMLLLAVVIAWLISAVVLFASGYLQKVMGDRALTAMERLMGMVLVLLAVEMLLTGVKEFFVA